MSENLVWDVDRIRADFPIFDRTPHIYLDNAATTHKPASVIKAITDFYEMHNANVHRGIYHLGSAASQRYAEARSTVADFIGAQASEIIFTAGCTDSINLVAFGLIDNKLSEGDTIVCLASEHHANLVPWQEVARRNNVQLKILHLTDLLDLDLTQAYSFIDRNTKLVAIAHTSNVTGARYPIEEVIAHSHKMGAMVLVDAAQALLSESVNVQDLGADFLAFSGHKMLGPTGCGVLYGRPEHLEQMQAIRFGGDMIRRVEYDQSTFAAAPRRFEAGTPPIAAVIGLAKAVDYINRVGVKAIADHSKALTVAAQELLTEEGFAVLGRPKHRGPILSFSHSRIHPHDLASILDERGIAIRAGHHCAQPFLKHLGLMATARVSFSLYNTHAEIESLGEGLRHAKALLL